MATITLYEKINKKKMEEVLKCNNILFEKIDDETWKEQFLTTLKRYYTKKPKKNGIEIRYEQSCNYGRYYTKYGLQTFQKDVRKYISGEFYEDVDFENCHPRIILDLLKKQNISCSSLKNYVDDKNKFLIENNITKTEFLTMLYNENPPNNLILKEIHQSIYGLWFDSLKKDQKTLFDRVKKECSKKKKNYNISGAFISMFIQNIENDLLKIVYEYSIKKGYIIGSLMFDGLLIEKTENSIGKCFKEIEAIIKKQTGYKIKLVLKSTETEWKPIIDKEIVNLVEKNTYDSTKYLIATSKILEKDCEIVDDDGNYVGVDEDKVKILHYYLNNFICRFNNPLSFGIRFNVNDFFQIKSKEKIAERIRYGFNCKKKDISWLDSDNALTFNKIVFEPNEKITKEDKYNFCLLYTSPSPRD
jgi:hypothetical protein